MRVVNDFIELTKPRITWLIVATAVAGYWLGSGVFWTGWPLLATAIGVGLLASGTAALNQWMERKVDALMQRTRSRPLASGRLSPLVGFLFGVGLSIAGFGVLELGTNRLSAILGLLTLAAYLLIYTPLKQRSPLCTAVGAVPGAMPPVIGYVAATGTIDPMAWTLFGILFLWQFPHFHAIAWLCRHDYRRAGIRMLAALDEKGEYVAREVLVASILLLVVSLLPVTSAGFSVFYLVGAVLLGCGAIYYAWRLFRNRHVSCARSVLLYSVLYLPLLMGLLVIERFSKGL